MIITGVWSPVSAKEKNISFNPIDMSAKALASPIIGHRGHPRQSRAAAFSCRKKLLCSSLLSSRQTKTACAGLKCDTRRARWTAAAARPRGSRSFARFLKWLPLISLMAGVPAETDKRSHSANVFFVHSVGKGCDRRYRRLQTSEESWPCSVTPPLICEVWAFYLFIFSWGYILPSYILYRWVWDDNT